MNQNPPDSNPPSLLDQVLTASVQAAGKVAATDLFLRLRELQGPLEELTGDLCEHSYRVLVGDFLALCIARQLLPDPSRFEAWLLTTTELPGYLVTGFSERLEQDQQDGLEQAPALDADLCARLAKLEEARLGAIAPLPAEPPVEVASAAPGDVVVAELIAANLLVPSQPDE